MKKVTATVKKVKKNEKLITWPRIIVFVTLIGLFNFSLDLTNDLMKNQEISFIYSFINEMTGPYTVLPLLPFLLWFFQRFPLTKRNWFKRLTLHLLNTVIYGFCYTILLIVIKKTIYWVLGMGSYNPGIFIYRFLSEFQIQAIVYWFIYWSGSLVCYFRENQERQLLASHLKQELTQARLKALKMQLNPHFLFNTLNMVSSYMYDDVKMADRMITNLSDLLRKTLGAGEFQEVSFKDELASLKLYLEIMKARYRDRLKIELDIPPETLPAKFPHLTLQPLVENSIKYSMDKRQKTVCITIRSQLSENRLFLTIEDNGPGINNDLLVSLKKGTGLKTVMERLHHLYGEEHIFKLTNRNEGGLSILIELPLCRSNKRA